MAPAGTVSHAGSASLPQRGGQIMRRRQVDNLAATPGHQHSSRRNVSQRIHRHSLARLVLVFHIQRVLRMRWQASASARARRALIKIGAARVVSSGVLRCVAPALTTRPGSSPPSVAAGPSKGGAADGHHQTTRTHPSVGYSDVRINQMKSNEGEPHEGPP